MSSYIRVASLSGLGKEGDCWDNRRTLKRDALRNRMGSQRKGRSSGEWARALSTAHFLRRRPTGCLLWYRLEPVADAPDTVGVGVVRRCLYAGPDAADVHIHRAAGGAPPGRPRTPDQLSATHGHPRGLRQGYKQAK